MVSSFGRVISLGRKIVNNLGVRITDPFIKKNNNITNSGYIQIRLWKNNKCNHLYAHRLVATAFIPNPNNYPCIDHIDTIKTNNHYLNLRWCTNSMNHLNPITRKRNSLSKIGARGIIENNNPGIVIYVTIKARHVMQLVLIRTGTRQKNPERITTARIHANL